MKNRDFTLNRGFTLVELIVAMVILAILAAIAIPSYSSYVLKSHRTGGQVDAAGCGEPRGALLQHQ